MKKAIIVGASSGIGRALAKVLSENEYIVGLAARRTELLQELQKELPSKSYIKFVDVAKQDEAIKQLQELADEMDGVDVIVIGSGIGFVDPELDWKSEKATIDVNVAGFAAMANAAFKYFAKLGYGHIVGISSIAGIRGMSDSPTYSASKAFVSNFLQGLRQRAGRMKAKIIVTDIIPGFVDTDLVKEGKLFWTAKPEIAARQIFNVIKKKKPYGYITKRWRIVAWLMKMIPDWMYNKY